MKIKTLLLITMTFLPICMKAQAPQIAVVRPDGTTFIRTTWDSAYAVAQNGDFIYLPGAQINLGNSFSISKRLQIYGAGHFPDSTSATMQTLLTGSLTILGEASGGSIEGVKVDNVTTLGGPTKLRNYTIKRCYFKGLFFTSPLGQDSLPENILITESIITHFNASSGLTGGGADNNLFIKNIISTYVWSFQYCTFKNNIFLWPYYQQYEPNIFNYVSHSLVENNIFLNPVPAPLSAQNCYNIYLNNLKLTNSNYESSETCPASAQDNISVPASNNIFISYDGNYGIIYGNNFHLAPGCPGIGAGNDGTDVGIYGTNNPTPDGWLPSNPHIFFKQVDGETGSDGKLHIKVGVRTNN
ncbi:MAG: hypothetical protein ABI761_06725 [Saprospiraceae bacterium]